MRNVATPHAVACREPCLLAWAKTAVARSAASATAITNWIGLRSASDAAMLIGEKRVCSAEATRSSHGKRRERMAVNPIPKGYRTVTPYLVVEGAANVLDFVKQAFGAEEKFRMDMPGGKIGHAEAKI